MKLIYVDGDRCLGCKTCEIECRVAHSEEKTLASAMSQVHPPKRRLFVEQQNGVKSPILCRHCDDSPCMAACITGSLYRDENGIVQRKDERCIGCWSCIMACPFGVVARDADLHLAVKCDRCPDREIPACAASCPTKALRIIDADDLPKERRLALLLREGG